ncbi:hypothetical protein [Georgenia wangjunii]|uniref:hypothetical protein n=1 Tax=Georgenia wangjunii TaxID=3117730 RepID=UPI002F26631A
MRRFTLVGASVLLSLVLWPGLAAADPPTRETFVDDAPFVTDEMCPFEVSITGSNTGRATLFYAKSGVLRRVIIHGTEEFTYSANGKELVAEPFPYNIHLGFGPDGQLQHSYVTGLVLRVPLPDGSTFLSAGRLDFVVTGEGFAITPQVGRSGDVEALCAALS